MDKVRATAQSLLGREIRPLHNWQEWFERWQMAVSLEEMVGLLHCGFNVSLRHHEYDEVDYDEIDRLVFYLTIADGWADDGLLCRPDETREQIYVTWRDKNWNEIRKSKGELRQQVARKAFEMLCHNFFKPELHASRNGFEGDWERSVLSERLFPIIQTFFRAEPVRFGDNIVIRNLPRSDSRISWELHVLDFFSVLVESVWGWEQHEVPRFDKPEQQQVVMEYNRATRVRLDSSKPWLVEVLSCMDKLNLLRKRMLDLDQSCLDKLKEIAMRAKLSDFRHFVKKARPVATLEEACLVGSASAWFLVHHELVLKERTRLMKILEAEQRAEDAVQEVRRLTGQ